MLISTKFHRPLTVGRLTQRPRLDGRLDDSLVSGYPLTLVTAPAGFGKSTLVSAWLQKQTVPASWLSLDSGDNDPGQFLSYLVGALQKIDPTLGASQTNRIQTAESADSEAVYADVLKHLVNEIAAQPSSFLLVLDDCHVLKNPDVLGLLNFLIEYRPFQLRLILLSREDLPLPISRLRVRRQMVEIRQADLQFSAEEAEDFLREGMGIRQLTTADILALEQRTEGWIAGLQLAGISIRSDPDPAHFIQSFTGSDRYILDYFMEEVFSRQPQEIQNFLLSSSILERFCAPLCHDLVEELVNGGHGSENDAQVMLERLERSNLFLIPLDNHRLWYRYHHLFTDLLRHALGQVSPQKAPTLHRRASQWLEKNGYIVEAVKHAFQTKDWIYAAELVERHAWNMILHSQVGTVSEWCNTLPEEIIGNRPALCIFHGWALIIAFKHSDFPAANTRIEQAEKAKINIDPEARASLVVGTQPVNLQAWVNGQLTLLRSFILMAESRKDANPQALIRYGQTSYEQLPPEDITGLSVSLLDISYAAQALSDAVEAEKQFAHVVGVALSGGNYFGAVVAEYHRAHGLFSQGKLHELISFCQQKKKTYEAYFSHPLQELPAIALLDQAQGCALLEMNEIEQAEKLLRSGLEVGQWMPREELPGYLALARLCYLKGDAEGMEKSLRRLEMRWPDIKFCTQAVRLVFGLLSHPEEAETHHAASAWANANPPEIGPGIVIPGIGPAFYDEADHAVFIAWAKIQILLGKGDEAIHVIQPMLDVAVKHELTHRVIELSLLEAQAYYIQGQKEKAWRPLSGALTRAEANGYLHLVDKNPILIRLLKEALRHGIAPNYIQRVLEVSSPKATQVQSNRVTLAPQASGTLKSGDGGVVEPLSSREKEVLALMMEGLSNTEIAARMFLSPNTLKAHAQNIFGKLGVHNRVQAVNKARDLKLI